MPRYTVVLDACVLVPIALADMLLRVAEKACTARCGPAASSPRPRRPPSRSTREWTRQALRADARGLRRRAGLRNSKAACHCLIRTTGTRRGDPGRRAGHHHRQREGLPRRTAHAARAGGSHPDDFLLDQLDLSPPAILQVIREQAAHTRRPPLTPRDLATLLGRAGVPGSADEFLRRLASPLYLTGAG
jgi:hypothetical protein